MSNVLVVAAHPDDEALGCGGTMARHAKNGDRVRLIFVADGVNSRGTNEDEIKRRRQAAERAASITGATILKFLPFPDQRLDTIPFLEIVQAIEKSTADEKPEIVYTHSIGDLNLDHRLVCSATLTAFRPTPGQSVKAIYNFEVPSSSEWHFGVASFVPNRFVDITGFLPQKIAALEAYHEEMREFPHVRSIKSLRMLAGLRGSAVGIEAAEAFVVAREIL